RLRVPMGVSYALEATSFTFITVLVARLGTNVMGGHQIVANLAALCFMVPLSLAVATATLTAHAIGPEGDAGGQRPAPAPPHPPPPAIGAEDDAGAQRTAAAGIMIAVIASAVLALSVWMLRGL